MADTQAAGASAPLLSLHRITKTYPGVIALNEVSVSFNAGEVHAIVGENGAGKSTMIKTIAGAVEPDEGTIEIAGSSHSALAPAISRGLGVEVIYQEFNLVPTLSVAENIFLGQKNGWRVDFKTMRQNAKRLLHEPGSRYRSVGPRSRSPLLATATGRNRQGARQEPAHPDHGRANSAALAGRGRKPVLDRSQGAGARNLHSLRLA